MNAVPVPKPGLMTVAEFLAWQGDGTDRRCDLMHGVPVAQAATSEEHGVIQANIAALLNERLRHRPPCRVVTEAGLYKSKRNFSYRSADVAVTCAPPVRGEPTRPMLLVEVLSPSNRAETLAKIGFYASFDSVREIVTVDSEQPQVIVYRRNGDDWADIPAEVLAAGDHLRLDSIDVTLDLADIYRNVPF